MLYYMLSFNRTKYVEYLAQNSFGLWPCMPVAGY